jgi:DNA-binding response OmpR family regulator
MSIEVSRKRILIIESDSDTLYILAARLMESGYTVETRRNGLEIVDGKNDAPDLFLIEKDLPLIDGIALCKYLKVHKESENVPVVMISSSNIRTMAIKAGVDEFLTKPFEISHLLKAIERCLLKIKEKTVKT